MPLVAGPDVVPRRAGRVLPIDPTGRVLLLCGFDPANPAQPFWFTVGGGVDPGETLAECAARELREEAGIATDPAALGDPVWHRTVEFGFNGTRYRQDEDYFVLRVGSRAVSLDGMDDWEKQTVTGYRWLTAPELDTLAEPFGPRELPGLLRELTA